MAAYVLYYQTEMIDLDAWSEYVSHVGEGLAKFGARVISSVPDPTILEGEWGGIHNVLIEFLDRETIERWYKSDDYKPQLELRLSAARGNLIVLDGV